MSEDSKVYIASKDVAGTDYRHLYLVYDLDGNLATDLDQRVIRGGNFSNDGLSANLVLEVNVPIAASQDEYNSSDPDAASRGTYQLNFSGLTADQAWALMTGFAASLGTVIAGNPYLFGEDYDTGYVYDYAPVVNSTGFNSNSTIVSILSQFDIRLQDVTPLDVTTTTPNDRFAVETFPDYNNQYGGTGDDKFLLESSARNIDGRGGSDTANFTNVFTGLTIDLTKEEFSGLLVDGDIKNVEHIIGTTYDDTIIGDVGANTLNGGSGVDTIRGGLGNDTILGGIGNDILNGEGGIDTVNGEAGNDTIIYRLSDHSIVLSGNEILNGGADNDTLKIELRSSELTMALRNELLAVYADMVVNPPLNGSSYTFTNLNLQISNFENMEVWVDGKQISLLPQAFDDKYYSRYESIWGETAQATNGNVFITNYPFVVPTADYSFGTFQVANAGTYATTDGGSITIESDGDFVYTPPSGSYQGQDSFTYSLTDTSGGVSTATLYLAYYDRPAPITGSSFVANPNIPVIVAPFDGVSFVGSNYNDRQAVINYDGDHITNYGMDGDDAVDALAASGEIYGGNGNDIVGFYSYNDFGFTAGSFLLDGGAGNDVLWINTLGINSDPHTPEAGDYDYGNLSTTSYGGDGDDYVICMNPLDDAIYGGDGNDTIQIRSLATSYTGGYGTDSIDGGSGTDAILFYAQSVNVNLALGQMTYEANPTTINTIVNVENVKGSIDDDVIYGSSVDNKLEGNDGNDELYGAGGNDLLYGGNGDDTYIIKTGEGVDQIFDTSGTDKIKFGTGITTGTLTYFSEGDDLLIKHNGTTLVRLVDHLYNANNIETIQFSDNSTLSLKDVFIRTLKGTEGADTITASHGAIQDVINGNGGNDAIYGYGGNDKVNGGAGNDTVYAHEGDDKAVYVYGENIGATDLYYGGTGSDTLELHFKLSDMTQDINDDLAAYYTYITNPTNINLNAATGAEYVFSEFGLTAGRFETVKVFVDGVEYDASNVGNIITGTSGDDYLGGTSGNDIINGLDGYNLFEAGNGHDIIIGGNIGDDEIYAEGGNDVIYGKGGFNYMQGGSGADTFVYEAATAFDDEDTILDFKANEGDKLNLSDLLIDYVPGISDINDYLSFDTTNPWSTKLVVDQDGLGTAYTGQSILGIYTGNSNFGTIDDLLNNGNIIV